MGFETTQVTLRLFDDSSSWDIPDTGETVTAKTLNKQLEENRVWKNDKEGKYIPLMFSGREFKFRKGIPQTVPQSIAKALLKASEIIVGPRGNFLSNPIVPFLLTVSQYEVGLEDPNKNSPKFVCPGCGKDNENPVKFSRHLMTCADVKRLAKEEKEKVASEPVPEPIGAEV